MTEEQKETQEQDVTIGDVESRAISMGLALQQAREKMGLSQEDVASRLRLSLRQVKALESEDFQALPDPMITRGFIRNYARLLEIDAEPLLEVYRARIPSDAPRAISIPSANILISGKDRSHWQVYIYASLVIALLLAAWLLYFEYFYQADEPAEHILPTAAAPAEEKPAEPMPEIALPAAERAADESAKEVILPAESAAQITEAPVLKPDVVAETVKAVPKVSGRLQLSFTEQTWVSVLDKDNVEIFNKNKPAGSEDVVEGQPPFKVVIGNAIGAKLTFNGKPVNLEPYTKLNVTRITLE